MACPKSLPSKFWQQGVSHYTMNIEFHTPLEWFMQMYIYKTWMEGTYDIPNKNPHFFLNNWTKSDGVFAKMQIISYSFIILKHIQVSSQFRKLLMLKVWLSFFFGGGGGQTA